MVLLSKKYRNCSDMDKIDRVEIILKNLFVCIAEKYIIIHNILREKITLPFLEKVVESLFLKESQESSPNKQINSTLIIKPSVFVNTHKPMFLFSHPKRNIQISFLEEFNFQPLNELKRYSMN